MANFRKNSWPVKKSQTSSVHLSHRIFFLYFLLALTFLTSCTFPVRSGYDRIAGGYKPIRSSTPAVQRQAEQNPEQTQQSAVSENKTENASVNSAEATQDSSHQTSAGKARSAAQRKSTPKPTPKKTTLESLAQSWIGTRYKMGGNTKKGTDCSGYVMSIYKEFYGIALDHNAAKIYKDSRGKSVSRGGLQEGDLVFFGDFWGINHVGIYLNGDRFTHASTSKGVIISPMGDKYWNPKYKGARRFKH